MKKKEKEIKISPLEISVGAIVMGMVLNNQDYIIFGICLYQNYYQK